MGKTRDWFTEVMTAEQVKTRSIQGVAASTLRRICTYAIRLGSLVFLARLLTPSDSGLIAMVTAVIGIAGILVDLQLSVVTIRFHDITHAQASNLFWIRVANAAVLTVIVIAAAPLVQSFYGDARVRPVAIFLSAGLMLGALGAQHSALLRKALRIGELARIEILSTAVTAAISVWGAFDGLGYWSLAVGSMAGSVASLVLSWSYCNWRPSAPARHIRTWPMLTHGFRFTAFSILAFVSGNLSNLIIGRSWGAGPAGQYARASNVQGLMLGGVFEPLGAVAGPAMAKLFSNPERMSGYYYKVTALAMMGAMPIAFVGLVLPHEFVRVLLGEQWDRCAEVLRLLSMGVLPNVLCNSSGWVFFSVGNSVAVMKWGLIGWGGMILGTAVGAVFGLEGLALANSLTITLLTVPCLLMAFRDTPLRLERLFGILLKPVLAGAIAGFICWCMLLWVPVTGSLERLVLGTGAFVLLYAALVLTVFGQRQLILDIIAQFRTSRAVAAV